MRVKSEVWVKAFLRRVMSDGFFATVVRHGDDLSGAIFIKVNRQDGSARLFGPAFAGLDSVDGERAFMPMLGGVAVSEQAVDEQLERECRFDSDLWIVEVERADGDPMLDGWMAPAN